MKKLKIDKNNCIGCGECAVQCPFSVLTMEDGYPTVGEGCNCCGACAEACPNGAIALPDYAGLKQDLSLWKGILIYAQYTSQGIHPITLEMAGVARKLAEKTGGLVYAVAIGEGREDMSELDGVADIVFRYRDKLYETFREDAYACALADCVKKAKPAIVLLGGTPEARTIAPRVAVACGTGLTADCTQLEIDENGNLVQIRPAFGGDLMAQILTEHTRPQFATVRANIMQAAEKNAEKVQVVDRAIEAASGIDVLNRRPLEPVADIADQRILVAVGGGVASKEDIPLFEELAKTMGGKLASSRLLVERGWMPGDRQIGISGKAVGCDLLITCGVSGSVQFMAGARGARHIVAINNDQNAPIFGVAHTLVCGDIYDIVPDLTKRLRRECNG